MVTMISILALVFTAFVQGISKAIKDTLAHHYGFSVFTRMKNQKYWNPKISQFNKYKNNNPRKGSKFFLSTTALVWVTDAWHLFQTIEIMSFCFAMVILGDLGLDSFWVNCCVVAVWRLLGGGLFELFYKYILLKSF